MDLPEATGRRTRRTASRQPHLACGQQMRKNGAYEFNKLSPRVPAFDGGNHKYQWKYIPVTKSRHGKRAFAKVLKSHFWLGRARRLYRVSSLPDQVRMAGALPRDPGPRYPAQHL